MSAEKLTAKDYQFALYSQSACNLSGIVFEFARVMQKICDQSNEDGHGTDWKNTHPICRLYAEQIMHLACGGSSATVGAGESYSKASEACEKAANTEVECLSQPT